MKNLHTYSLTLILILTNWGYSQNAIPSKTYIQACYNSHECYSISNSAFLFLDHDNSEFIVKVNFNKFKVENDTIDEWLNYLPDSQIIFKGHIRYEDEFGSNHPVLKPIFIKGNIQFNGITKPYHLQIMTTNNPIEGSQFVSNTKNHFDIVYASLQLSFNPHDFKIDSKHHRYKKTFNIAISKGYINNLTPELKLWLENDRF